jgi:hypothetical protein
MARRKPLSRENILDLMVAQAQLAISLPENCVRMTDSEIASLKSRYDLETPIKERWVSLSRKRISSLCKNSADSYSEKYIKMCKSISEYEIAVKLENLGFKLDFKPKKIKINITLILSITLVLVVIYGFASFMYDVAADSEKNRIAREQWERREIKKADDFCARHKDFDACW